MLKECPQCGHQTHMPNRTSKTRDQLFKENIDLRRENFELRSKLNEPKHKPRIKLMKFQNDQPELMLKFN